MRTSRTQGACEWLPRSASPSRRGSVSGSEYARREAIKDGFKARYFTQDEIEYKRKDLLEFMEGGQVSLDHLIRAASGFFPHVAIIGNSCNFYTIVASRDPARVRRFCAFFIPPFLPQEYRSLDIPYPLKAHRLEGVELAFRHPGSRLLAPGDNRAG